MKPQTAILSLFFFLFSSSTWASKIFTFPMDTKKELKEVPTFVNVSILGDEAKTIFEKISASPNGKVFNDGGKNVWYLDEKTVVSKSLGLQVSAIRVWDDFDPEGKYKINIRLDIKKEEWNKKEMLIKRNLDSKTERDLDGLNDYAWLKSYMVPQFSIKCKNLQCSFYFSSEINTSLRLADVMSASGAMVRAHSGF